MGRRPPPLPRCHRTGKLSYDSRLLALDALNGLDRNRLRCRLEAGVYVCPHCGAYHLTKHEADGGREE